MDEDEKKDKIAGTATDEGSQETSATGTAKDDDKKTYSTSEIKAMMAKEKASGRNALLKELGVEDFKSYKEGLDAYKKHVEDQKTEVQKAKEAAETLTKAKEASDNRALQLETQMQIIKAKGVVDFVDDISVLVRAKVSDTVTLEKAIEAVREKHPEMFEGTASTVVKSKGTGTPPAGKKAADSTDLSLAQRLAQEKKPTTEKKSSYFSRS